MSGHDDNDSLGELKSAGAPGVWIMFFFGVLVLGLFLRVRGLGFGEPDASCRPDEDLVIREAIYIVSGDQVRYHRYPPALMYGQAACFRLGAALGFLPKDAFMGYAQDPLPYHLIGRWLSLILGFGTLVVVGMTARKLSDWRGATLATLALACFPLHVLHSHFATVDVPGTFFVALSIYFVVCSEKREPKFLIFSGIAAGLAAATKYPMGFVAITPLIGALRGRRPLRLAILVSLATLSGLLLGAPTWLFSPMEVWQGLQVEAGSQSGRRALVGLQEILSHHWRFSLIGGFGLINAILGFLGLLVARKRGKDVGLGFVFILLIFNLFLGVPFARYFLPLAPVLSLGLVSLCCFSSPRWRWAFLLCLLVVQVPNALLSYTLGSTLQEKDTRGQLLEAFADGSLPQNLPIIRPSWPFETFPAATNGKLLLAPTSIEPSLDRRTFLLRSLAFQAQQSPPGLKVLEFGKETKDFINLEELLKQGDFLYIAPETPAFADASLTFPIQKDVVTPHLVAAAKAGKITMKELLDLKPFAPGEEEFPPSNLYEGFDYWFIPMNEPGRIQRPGPRIHVYRISAR